MNIVAFLVVELFIVQNWNGGHFEKWLKWGSQGEKFGIFLQ